jgi:hypothetical protein
VRERERVRYLRRAPICKTIALKFNEKTKDTKGWRGLVVERVEKPKILLLSQKNH